MPNLVIQNTVDNIDFITECAHLSSPLAGSVTQNGSAVGAVADYSCVAGYQLKGPISRSCSITGNWTGTKPICELIGKSNEYFSHVMSWRKTSLQY